MSTTGRSAAATQRVPGETVAVPVYLASGLHAGNVADAIRQVGPFGVDVCSGVRTDGLLDEDKLRRFFAAVDRASAH